MKFSLFFSFTLLGLGMAAPMTLENRQASEGAKEGFATLNGGTHGGIGGKTVTVSSLAALVSAVMGDDPAIVIISGIISGAKMVQIGSNKSIIGKSGASLVGVGLSVRKKNNVIIRNLKISKVLASTGDAISIQYANNIWIDHVEFSSDKSHGKDFYDGLLDITHGCDFVTVSNCFFHDHFKTSLVGHADLNSSEDSGHLTVTYAHNHWKSIGSRAPSIRFGTCHVYNNFFEDVEDGINTRKGARVLVEGNVFSGAKKPLYSTDGGFAMARDNDFGGASNSAAACVMTVPYSYNLAASSSTKASVLVNAGAKLSF